MNRLAFPLLLFLALALALPTRAAAPLPAGVERLTIGAALYSVEGWRADGTLLARRGAEGEAWVAISEATGNIAAALAPRPSLAAPRLHLSVVGGTHTLWLDGKRLWQSDDEIIGQVRLSPDGRWLLVQRTPRGSAQAAWGELWRLDVADGRWTPLTANATAEGDPAISPDGRRVAFLRGGDLWLLPADRRSPEPLADPTPDSAPLALLSHEPPTHIRVKHVSEGVPNPNNCRPGVPHGHIETIPFEEYVRRVVPHESPPSWHAETLKAQAVAARTYAWRYVLAPAGPDFDVTDTTSHQYMCDSTVASTDAAVAATTGQHVTFGGALATTLFSAENSSPTRQNAFGHAYLSAVDDPLSFGFVRRGHGQGFSQWGGKRLADAGWSYLQLLGHYFPGAQVEPPAGSSRTLLEVRNRPVTAWLRGSALHVALNATNASRTRLRQWWHDGTWRLSDWQDDSDSTDGWTFLLDLRPLGERPFDSYRVEAASVPENVGVDPRPVLRYGIDRTLPSLGGTIATSQGSSGVVTATLAFAASDALSGVERLGWSLPGWAQEAEAVPIGPVVGDATASGGGAVRLHPATDSATTLAFAPFTVSAAPYRLWFRLRVDQEATAARVATLRLFDGAGTPLQRGVRYLRAGDFAGTGWEWFFVDVDATTAYGGSAASSLSAHIEWHGESALSVDRLLLATRPATLPHSLTLPLQGSEAVTLYASDAAGNVALLRCGPVVSVAHAAPAAPAPTGSTLLYLPLVMGRHLAHYDCLPVP